jgi:hypothetical protein
LKPTQNHYEDPEHPKNQNFNKKIHADIFTKPSQTGSTILSITDEKIRHSTTTIIPDNSSHTIAQNLDKHWFSDFGFQKREGGN